MSELKKKNYKNVQSCNAVSTERYNNYSMSVSQLMAGTVSRMQ